MTKMICTSSQFTRLVQFVFKCFITIQYYPFISKTSKEFYKMFIIITIKNSNHSIMFICLQFLLNDPTSPTVCKGYTISINKTCSFLINIIEFIYPIDFLFFIINMFVFKLFLPFYPEFLIQTLYFFWYQFGITINLCWSK